MPRDGRLTEATTCKCQAGSNLRKDFNCDYEWNNKLEDPGSAEFKEFVQYCQAKIDNVLSKDSTLFQNGYLGVSLLSAKASASNSGRKKRNTGGTTTSTDVSTSGTTTGTQVDGAAASGGDSSVSSASTATRKLLYNNENNFKALYLSYFSCQPLPGIQVDRYNTTSLL